MVRIHTTYAKRPIRSFYFAQIFGEIQNCKILNFVLFPQTRAAEMKKTGNFLPVFVCDLFRLHTFMGDCGFAHANSSLLLLFSGICLKGPPRWNMPPACSYAPLCTDFRSTRLALALGSNPQTPIARGAKSCSIRAAGAANSDVLGEFAAQK